MKSLFFCCLAFLFPYTLPAAVKLPGILSDHGVLQRSAQTAVWGTASPGETVTITFGPLPEEQAKADAQGRWRAELDLSHCDKGPFELTVKGSAEPLVVHDLAVGDVWICSGQSNMAFELSQTAGGPEEIAHSADPLLRYFQPIRQAVAAPAEDLPGHWMIASPETSGRFSGVAYYFAKKVIASQHGPIGLVNTSWGGTSAEAWISSAGMDRDPALKTRKDAILASRPGLEQRVKEFGELFRRWAEKYHRVDSPADNVTEFADPKTPTTDWKTVHLPGTLASQGLPDSGVVWLRHEVEFPANRAGVYQPLQLGTLRDFETVYWNCKKVGETTASASTSTNPDMNPTLNRRYDIPGTLVKGGKATLAIRLYSPGGNAGIEAARISAGWDVSLNGDWQAKVEREFPALPADAAFSYPRHPEWPAPPQYTATYINNGMVHPLRDLSMRGVLWYQGESNQSHAHQYRTTFPLLIQDWRDAFHQADLPFYFCQLANYSPKRPAPGESSWAELREAQAQALSLPHTGMAVLIDLGEENDIHFRNKKDAGERLAAVVLSQTYDEKLSHEGPTYQSSSIEGSKIRLHFANIDGGLEARTLPDLYQPMTRDPATKPLVRPSPQSELQGFAICGEDKRWKWADAQIEGDTVVAWSAEVPSPKEVRYAWADDPTCNLYNKAGFPAVPFRTDHFPDSTEKASF